MAIYTDDMLAVDIMIRNIRDSIDQNSFHRISDDDDLIAYYMDDDDDDPYRNWAQDMARMNSLYSK